MQYTLAQVREALTRFKKDEDRKPIAREGGSKDYERWYTDWYRQGIEYMQNLLRKLEETEHTYTKYFGNDQ